MPARWRLHIGRLWQIGREPHALAARALVFRHARSNRVSTVTAYEPTVLVGDHRPEFDAQDAIGAADNQDRVGWQLALLCMSRETRTPDSALSPQ
jgi:hypothetical protein